MIWHDPIPTFHNRRQGAETRLIGLSFLLETVTITEAQLIVPQEVTMNTVYGKPDSELI